MNDTRGVRWGWRLLLVTQMACRSLADPLVTDPTVTDPTGGAIPVPVAPAPIPAPDAPVSDPVSDPWAPWSGCSQSGCYRVTFTLLEQDGYPMVLHVITYPDPFPTPPDSMVFFGHLLRLVTPDGVAYVCGGGSYWWDVIGRTNICPLGSLLTQSDGLVLTLVMVPATPVPVPEDVVPVVFDQVTLRRGDP